MHYLDLGILIMMGISLAAVAGLRAFLPLCVIGWLARVEFVQLGASFDWLSSDAALVIFTLASVLEIVADKVPVVDNVLDQVADYVKPIAGTILVSATISEWNPLPATVFGILTGGTIATLFHQGKKMIRLTSTAASLGTANPMISSAEDAASVVGILMAFVAPVVSFILVAFAGLLLYRGGRRIYLRFRGEPSGAPV